ncbi:MAG: FtsW/RodA/SpoVE family cell cycle protein, partial [Actinobacteria bacterium]|nr:FtsW/RodA/SpoVE family cell cycle protein [Actinomycetota bacterium]
ATARVKFIAAFIGLFIVGSVAVYQGTPHVRERVVNWLHPWTSHAVCCALTGQKTPRQECASYQLVQSLYSIGHGGYGGTGLGSGVFTTPQGHPLIPYLNTDFIYSAVAQEIGLIGASALLLIYMVFCLRGFRVALAANDGFSKLLAAGLTFGFALQTFVIVGGILRVIPLTGITLPFVSYGGSSVIANFLVVAGLMLVSHRANSERGAA